MGKRRPLKGESPRRIQWLKEILESFPGALSPVVSGYEQQESGDTQEDNSALLQKLMQLPESIRGFAFAMTKLTEKEKKECCLQILSILDILKRKYICGILPAAVLLFVL